LSFLPKNTNIHENWFSAFFYFLFVILRALVPLPALPTLPTGRQAAGRFVAIKSHEDAKTPSINSEA
jgi:hypothetical protein